MFKKKNITIITVLHLCPVLIIQLNETLNSLMLVHSLPKISRSQTLVFFVIGQFKSTQRKFSWAVFNTTATS